MSQEIDIRQELANLNIELRDYQLNIVSKVVASFIDKRIPAVMIESPCGSGKTVMALAAAYILHKMRDDLRIGWVSMRRYLLTQVIEENKTKGFNLPMFVFSMLCSDPPSNLHLLIVDECHRDACNSMGFVHRVTAPLYTLGLSGTAFRHDRVKLCFDKVIKEASIQRLVSDGYLSKYWHYTISTWTPEVVTEHYIREPQRWGKSVMYFPRIEQCMRAMHLLLDNGIAADVVTGNSKTDKQLEQFANNELNVLINCNKLTEGFNQPSLKTVFVRPSGKGCTIQMAGRVLRTHPDMPVKQIVQSVDTRYNFGKVVDAALSFTLVDNEWRSLTLNPAMDSVLQKTRLAIARTSVKLPKAVTTIKKDRSGRVITSVNDARPVVNTDETETRLG